jgi:hypothetical protein
MVFEPKYKLRDWIPQNKLDLQMLNMNPNAFRFLMNNKDKICCKWISKNTHPEVSDYFKTTLKQPNDFKRLCKQNIARNPAAIPFLNTIMSNQNQSYTIWKELNENASGIWLLQKYHPELIDWEIISANPGATHLFTEENMDKICWKSLSRNPHPFAIQLLESNRDKINITELCRNTNATNLIRSFLKPILSDPCPIYMFWNLTINPCAVPILKEHPENNTMEHFTN